MNKIEIVPNELGARITPSYVAFPGNDRCLVGDAAKKHGMKYPEQCIFEVKRLMGQSFRDSSKRCPLKLSSGPLGGVLVNVGEKEYRPEDISASLLKQMRSIAEDYADRRPIKDAVISVPAYFIYHQRRATMAAGVSAELNVLRLISEPTTAALAYGHQRLIGSRKIAGVVYGDQRVIGSSYGGGGRRSLTERCWGYDELGNDTRDRPNYKRWDQHGGSVFSCRGAETVGKNILVFDMGGGTFDVSIVTMKEGPQNDFSFVVKAVAGDTHLGGTEIDKRLFKHVAEQFGSELERKDFLVKPRIRTKLNQLVVDAKHDLSIKPETEIDLDCGGDNVLSLRLNRTKFEALNQDLFDKCMTIVEQALRDAKISKSDISDVLLAGGSARIPRVQEMRTAFFGKTPIKSVHPDEAVAFGAAVQAGLLARQDNCVKASISVRDVTSVSIGVGAKCGITSMVIPRNSSLPAAGSAYFFLMDFQKSFQTMLYEGDRALCKNNRPIGELKLDGFTPCPATLDTSIEVELKIDANGILHATAEAVANHGDIGTKVETTVTLDTDFVQYYANVSEATDWYMPQAKAEDARIWAAETSMYKLRKLILTLREQHSSNECDTDLKKHLTEAWDWWSKHEKLASEEDYKRRYAELEQLAKVQNLAVTL
ncbi:hypothetical protein CBR_g28753 [Chara braunii]|uniref:Uncharacterized protein n=1 Tax=Chara braunii TaxID=69332 RepID=A0A388L9Q3_CHABU|nr:hypothetical protein CBR_g28753 [Chara braunii]|eukprot:GBG79039.1 hypothetical protein CBR_g28753 [Chara braunii]